MGIKLREVDDGANIAACFVTGIIVKPIRPGSADLSMFLQEYMFVCRVCVDKGLHPLDCISPSWAFLGKAVMPLSTLQLREM